MLLRSQAAEKTEVDQSDNLVMGGMLEFDL